MNIRYVTRDSALLFLTYWILSYPFLRKFSAFNDLSMVHYIDEILLLASLPCILHGFKASSRRSALWLFLILYSCYLFVSVMTALAKGVNIQPLAFQFLDELKVPLVVLAFLGLTNPERFIDRFLVVAKALLVISIPLVLLKIVARDSYLTVFDGTPGGVLVTANSIISRAEGFFWHPSQLAFFSSIMGIYFFSLRVLCVDHNATKWFLIALGLLVASLQRQELAAFLAILALIWFAGYRERWTGQKFIYNMMISVFVASFVWFNYSSLSGQLDYIVKQMGLHEIEYSSAARVVFYYQSFVIAVSEFPFGTGMGSFGGVGAARFGSPTYAQLGFDQYWWYNAGVYLTDTFWPHVLGEGGVLGAGFFLASFLALLRFLTNTSSVRWGHLNGHKSVMTFSARYTFLYLIIVSVTSAVISNIFALVLTFLWASQRGSKS